MIFIESILLTLMICTCAYLTYCDFKTGLIPNKVLAVSGAAAFMLDFIYYTVFMREFAVGFLINFGVTSLISFLLYCFHFWGAGDSKFVIFIVLCIPLRFYNKNDLMSFPSVNIIVQTFAIAFLYLVAESVILGIIHKNFFDLKNNITLKSILRTIYTYILSYLYIMFFNAVESILFKYVLISNKYIAPLMNFFIIIVILNCEKFKKWYLFIVVLVLNILAIIVNIQTLNDYILSPINLLIILLVITFRQFADKYNYKTILTNTVKKGDVLTVSTVMLFRNSRVKGLPEVTTEDFRSRISAEEAESIKRWERSVNGKSEITIVRKLPFAIFIFISTIIFLGMRGNFK